MEFKCLHGSNPAPLGGSVTHIPCPVSPQCRAVCGLNTSDRCDFVRRNPDCRSEGGYLDYLEGIFCYFPPNLLSLAITLYVSLCLGPGNGRVSVEGCNSVSFSGPHQVFWLLYLFLILGVTAAKL